MRSHVCWSQGANAKLAREHASLPLKAAEHSLLGLESLLFSGVIFKSRLLESPIGFISSRDKDETVHSPLFFLKIVSRALTCTGSHLGFICTKGAGVGVHRGGWKEAIFVASSQTFPRPLRRFDAHLGTTKIKKFPGKAEAFSRQKTGAGFVPHNHVNDHAKKPPNLSMHCLEPKKNIAQIS